MTEESKRIREEFVEMINQDSSNLSQYNWIDITKGFDNETMTYTICRIKDENVAREVIKCILDAWNYAIEHKDPICKATDPDTFRKDVYKYRPPHTLGYTLNQILKSRKIFVDMHSFKGKNSIGSSKDIVQNDERLLELEAENKRLSEKKEEIEAENKELKKQLEQLQSKKSYVDSVKLSAEVERLKDELHAYKERSQNRAGINRKLTAHLGIILAPKLNIYYKNKKELAPVLSQLFGWGERSLEQQLCTYLSRDEELELANIFGQISPDLAKEICKEWQGTLPQKDEAPPSE